MVFGWFIILIIFLIIELLIEGLVSIWFVIGSMAAILSTVYTRSIFYQFIVFFIVSVISKILIELSVKELQVKNKSKPKASKKRKSTSNGKKNNNRKSTSKKTKTTKKKK